MAGIAWLQGSIEQALAQAKAQLDRVYGVSMAFGLPTLTKFPPERSYPAVGGDTAYVYQQAAEAVKQATGKDIPTQDIALLPIQHDTAAAFDSGKPTPYQLAYVDRSSGQPVFERVYGKAFVADTGRAQNEAAFELNSRSQQDIVDRAEERAMQSQERSTVANPFAQPEQNPKTAVPGSEPLNLGERIKRDAGTLRQNVRKMQVNPTTPAAGPDIPASASDKEAATRRAKQITVDERRRKAGLPPYYGSDIP